MALFPVNLAPTNAVAVTLSGDTTYTSPNIPRGVWVGTAGNGILYV